MHDRTAAKVAPLFTRIPIETKIKLENLAADHRRKIADYVRILVEDHVAHEELKAKIK